jgi:hypothetical protein
MMYVPANQKAVSLNLRRYNAAFGAARALRSKEIGDLPPASRLALLSCLAALAVGAVQVASTQLTHSLKPFYPSSETVLPIK